MPINSITPIDLKERLDNGEDIVVIDVRNPWELEITQVDFAENIVMDELPQNLDQIPKDKPVILICRSGGRSRMAGNFLVSKGWDENNLFNLEGGILGWAEEVDDSLPTYY